MPRSSSRYRDAISYEDSEVVLGLVGAIGTDLDRVQRQIEGWLKSVDYQLRTTRLSGLVQDLGLSDVPLRNEPELDRYSSYMDAGNACRRAAGAGDLLALAAVASISRTRQGGPTFRTVHLLRSLKHPEELDTLRRVYGPAFFLLGVYAPPADRRQRLLERGVPDDSVEDLMARDEAEDDTFGQETRAVFQRADAFISTATDCDEQVSRILELLFGNPHQTPTVDEYAMFLAFSASLRSSDLSRQVGAVVLNQHREVLATGVNEVPRAGGGPYWPGDDPDERDFSLGFDSNERRRDELLVEIMRRFPGAETTPEEELLTEGRRLLAGTALFDLTEFGRVVHAEMDALLACTRRGISARDGILYSTTFPCHNCAKHIIAAGIKRVVYVEPYPKSLALQLHGDALAHGSGNGSKVRFEPFVGIGPRRFFDLFSLAHGSGRRLRRKSGGEVRTWKAKGASIRHPIPYHSYLDREQMATEQLDSIMEGTHGDQ